MFRTNRTEPSANRTFTPPAWKLRAVESPLLWLPLPQSHLPAVRRVVVVVKRVAVVPVDPLRRHGRRERARDAASQAAGVGSFPPGTSRTTMRGSALAALAGYVAIAEHALAERGGVGRAVRDVGDPNGTSG